MKRLTIAIAIAVCVSSVYLQAIGAVIPGAAAAAAAAASHRRTVNNGALHHSGAGLLIYQNPKCELKDGAFPRVAMGWFDFSHSGGWSVWSYYAKVVHPAEAACLISVTVVPITNGYAGQTTAYSTEMWFVYAPWSDVK